MLTKKEFLQQPEMKSVSKNLNGAAICAYVCAAISLLGGFLLGNMLIIIDIAIVVGLALGIQLSYNRGCAIGLTVYAVFNMIVTLLSTGRPGGWLVLVAGIYAIMATFQFKKAWDLYTQTGEIAAPEK